MKKTPLPDYQAQLPRFCEHCGRPLPPGEHGLRKFCAKWYDQYGQVHDCKSDFHTLKNKPQNDEFRSYRNTVTTDAATIATLISKFGNEVTTAQLAAHSLEITRSIDYDITEDGKIVSQFHGYLIISNSTTQKHKIEKL